MKLEVGKEYKTLSGKKVEIIRELNCTQAYSKYRFLGILPDERQGELYTTWAENGKISQIADHPNDIVGPWVEPRPRMLGYFEHPHNSVESRIRMYPESAQAPKGWVRAPWLDEPEAVEEAIEEHA